MHVIYSVRRGRKYHTDQSHRILLNHYFFYLREGRHFDLWPLALGTMGYYAIGRITEDGISGVIRECPVVDIGLYVDKMYFKFYLCT